MDVDVVIVAYNSAGHLRAAVEPLAGRWNRSPGGTACA
jgi:hypothetical protein